MSCGICDSEVGYRNSTHPHREMVLEMAKGWEFERILEDFNAGGEYIIPSMRQYIEDNFLGGRVCRRCRIALSNKLRKQINCFNNRDDVEIFATSFLIDRGLPKFRVIS